jgi:poly(3-hydroxybutyrate) depolymerase
MLYYLYELNHAVVGPARALADAGRIYMRNPFNPLAHTPLGKNAAAGFEMFERMTRRYGKPEFGIHTVESGGRRVLVTEEVVWQRPFCELRHFRKHLDAGVSPGPKLLMVAPMSGHYASLLRGTVEAMLPDHDVYITDWADARMVPLTEGIFDLDDYIDYITEMFHALGPGANVIAVCQPSVPVLAAVSLMEEDGDPNVPATMTLMGGPIDTRVNATAVNQLAEERGSDWFADNVIVKVPFPNPGVMRDVYPGFLQLTGFMSMNLDRHVSAHYDLFNHLVEGDGDSAEKHTEFYDEYLAVMDLDAAFYLQTIDTVFVRHLLPRGKMTHRGRPVDPAAITRTALMTVEGEHDDISGLGQTEAAHKLCRNIPKARRLHYVQPSVGHYGVFNGSRYRREVAPRIATFIAEHGPGEPAANGKAPARRANGNGKSAGKGAKKV